MGSKVQVVSVKVFIIVKCMFTSFDSSAGTRFTISLLNLLKEVDHLRLANLAIENSSLSILEDDVLQSLRFLWLDSTNVSESDISFRRQYLAHHCLLLLPHRCFLFFLSLPLLHLLLHLCSLLFIHCHFY